MRRNYHSHTYRCRHAGDVQDEEYVLAAIRSGYEFYGFSDHIPWPFRDGLAQKTRMETTQFSEYVSAIRALAEKYQDQIEIRLGMECEGYHQHYDHLKTLAKSVDYLILGHHFGSDDVVQNAYFGGKKPIENGIAAERMDFYTEDVTRAMESGLFCCLAHPDFILAHYPAWDEHCENMAHTVCKTAKALDLPIEYNLRGKIRTESGTFTGLGFPNDRFWQIAAQYGLRAIVGIDAHSIEEVTDTHYYDDACAYLDAAGLRRIDRLF